MTMICECGSKMKCMDSRNIQPQVVRRRHQCMSCGIKFSSIETTAAINSDGHLELVGIITASNIAAIDGVIRSANLLRDKLVSLMAVKPEGKEGGE